MHQNFKVAAIVILVGSLAFALGRLSVLYGSGGGLKIEYPAAAQSAAAVIASKTGSKYFLPWCGGASQIKPENRVYFSTTAEAETAGYTPAANCKGM